MAEIKPLRALKYSEKAGPLSKNVCPPYDVISEQEEEELLKSSPYNLVRLEKPHGADRYAKAASLLESWLSSGVLERDKEECFYIYGEDFKYGGVRRSLKGIICLCRLSPFSEGVVLPHENTLSAPKADRLELMKSTLCNFSSIYGLYQGASPELAELIQSASSKAPEQCFEDEEGVTHSLWRLSGEKAVSAVVKALAPKQIFIADGHHRYETSIALRDRLAESDECAKGRDYVLMTLVDMDCPGLLVLPTHRLIRGVKVDADALLRRLADSFDTEVYADVGEAERVLARHADRTAFALYTGGEGFVLLLLKGAPPKGDGGGLDALDVSVLQSEILEKCLGISAEDIQTKGALGYTRSVAEAVQSVKSGECGAAFLLNPTKISEIKSVSLSGGKMPQKSTYFYPKLKSGLVMNTVKDRD